MLEGPGKRLQARRNDPAVPLIVQHVLSAGFSYDLTGNLAFAVAYVHGFENATGGPGPLPGYSVASKVSADAFGMGFTLRY